MPQPTSKPGQPGGNQGPTRPTNLPVDFSSTTNMPMPCSTQCPAMMAALRHPTNSSVTGFPSAVMYRAVPGSDSIAVFAAMSAPRHGRSFRRSVSMTGLSGWASVTPGLRGAIISFLDFLTTQSIVLCRHGRACPGHDEHCYKIAVLYSGHLLCRRQLPGNSGAPHKMAYCQCIDGAG